MPVEVSRFGAHHPSTEREREGERERQREREIYIYNPNAPCTEHPLPIYYIEPKAFVIVQKSSQLVVFPQIENLSTRRPRLLLAVMVSPFCRSTKFWQRRLLITKRRLGIARNMPTSRSRRLPLSPRRCRRLLHAAFWPWPDSPLGFLGALWVSNL